MANRQLSEVIEYLRRAVLPREGVGRSDCELLDEYIRRRDEAPLVREFDLVPTVLRGNALFATLRRYQRAT